MLGRVIVAVSGKRLGDFLEERLFEPLGMNDTAFFVAPDKADRLAQGLEKNSFSGNAIKLYDYWHRRATTPAARARFQVRWITCASRRCWRTAASSTASGC